MCCKQGLPRFLRKLAMTEGWIPIFMGMTERGAEMTDKMGTLHRAPTLGRNKK